MQVVGSTPTLGTTRFRFRILALRTKVGICHSVDEAEVGALPGSAAFRGVVPPKTLARIPPTRTQAARCLDAPTVPPGGRAHAARRGELPSSCCFSRWPG